ncbi:hypothetical protein D9M72_590670 [compost metagenome]
MEGQSSAVRETKKILSKPWVSEMWVRPRRDLPVTAPISSASRDESVCIMSAMPGNKSSWKPASLRTPAKIDL